MQYQEYGSFFLRPMADCGQRWSPAVMAMTRGLYGTLLCGFSCLWLYYILYLCHIISNIIYNYKHNFYVLSNAHVMKSESPSDGWKSLLLSLFFLESQIELIPRPARACADPPLYLRLRMGKPIGKTMPLPTYVMSYGKNKLRPEFWFSIPKNRTDELYRFLNTWVPHLYGELDEEQITQRGFELIQHDTDWVKGSTNKVNFTNSAIIIRILMVLMLFFSCIGWPNNERRWRYYRADQRILGGKSSERI